jgi:hypothetical protein
MRDPFPQQLPWSFLSPLGALCCNELSGQVDVARPQLGLHQLELHSVAVDGSICGVEREISSSSQIAAWPAKVADAYVRGLDLIASYHPADGWPFAPLLYWHCEPPDAAPDMLGGLSLVVSVSTHLLDTHPRIHLVSRLDVEETLYFTSPTVGGIHEHRLKNRSEWFQPPSSGLCCLLLRLWGGQVSYAEIIQASDFCQLFVQRDVERTCQTRWELFAEFLEKGVIRRTRLQAIFLPRTADLELAKAWCRRIAARPLPLTT